jgi:hypothetical protein
MEIEDVMSVIEHYSADMQAAILRGLEGAYTSPDDTKRTWLYHMSGEYSGNVLSVIIGIREAVKPLLPS